MDNYWDGFTISTSRAYPASVIEIGNSPDYATAKKVYQPPEFLSDNSIQVRADLSGLGSGPYYMWITNNRQQRTAAYALSSTPPQPCPGNNCCQQGQTCQGGSFQSSSDCGSLCCVGGTCQTPSTTCASQGFYCCPSGYTCSQTRTGSGCSGTCCSSQTYCTQPSTCPDGTCSPGETCPQDRCCSGVSYTTSQVCCSGSVFTGNCCSNSDCPSGQSCSNHACSGTSCTCTSWVNGACGGSCPSQRQQARTCTPSGCDTTSRCIADAACGSSTGELVLHLNLNEGSGTSASDSSGKGNTATITGATWTTDSKSGGQALSLGSSGYIRVPASSSMGFDKSQGTIGMWIKPTSPISDSYQLLAMDSSYGIELNIQPEGNLFFYPWVDPSWNDYNLVTNPLSAGQWQHLAVTWDYSTKAVKLYVNGAEKTPSVQNVPTYWTAIASTADWHIGGSPVKDQYLAGLIDEIKVYSKALTPAEILQDYSGSTCIHKSDTDCSGCVSTSELTNFIQRWFTSNADVTMAELIQAIGLWKSGTGCA
jgi:hypothetical protein